LAEIQEGSDTVKWMQSEANALSARDTAAA
jgi:hypothetical protein